MREFRSSFINLCLNWESYFWLSPWSPVTSRSFIRRVFSALGTELGQSSSHCLAFEQSSYTVLVFYLVLPNSSDSRVLLWNQDMFRVHFWVLYPVRFCIPPLLNLLNLKTFMKSNSWNILPVLNSWFKVNRLCWSIDSFRFFQKWYYLYLLDLFNFLRRLYQLLLVFS